MQKTRRKTALPLLAAFLTLFALASMAITAQTFSLVGGATMLGSMFIAPGAAFDAGERYIEQIKIEQEADDFIVQGETQQNVEDIGSLQNTSEEQGVGHEGNNSQNSTQAQDESLNGTGQQADSTSGGKQDAEQQAPQPMPEGAIPITSAFYTQGTSAAYVQTGSGSIRNFTQLTSDEIAQYVGQGLPFTIQQNSAEPQVLIMHTHATESYVTNNNMWTLPEYTARSTDNEINITSVGAIIAKGLNTAGINTLHDTTLHDYPSYNGSYDRSYKTVQSYLQQYPSIKVVIDVHRDALYGSEGEYKKPVAEINGEQVAQVMIISCASENGNLPNYTENLKFAAEWEAKMEEMYPGLTRPVLFDYRYYNQDLTSGSLLLEVGGHVNTLDEAKKAAGLVSNTLVALLLGQ